MASLPPLVSGIGGLQKCLIDLKIFQWKFQWKCPLQNEKWPSCPSNMFNNKNPGLIAAYRVINSDGSLLQGLSSVKMLYSPMGINGYMQGQR